MINYLIDKEIEITRTVWQMGWTALKNQPKFFFRYADDCFSTFINIFSIDIFLRNLNSEHYQIQINKEMELHNYLAFLDVWSKKLTKELKLAPIANLHALDTIQNFLAFQILGYQRNLVSSLLHRSNTICKFYSQMETNFISPSAHLAERISVWLHR